MNQVQTARKQINKWLHYGIFMCSSAVIPMTISLITIFFDSSILVVEGILFALWFGLIAFFFGAVPAFLTAFTALHVKIKNQIFGWDWVICSALIGAVFSFMIFLLVSQELKAALIFALYGLVAGFFSALLIMILENRK